MGAWDHKAYDNDSACEWLDGVAELLSFTLDHGFWSRWTEEGIAAAQLLCDLPRELQNRIGPQPFNEALEIVDAELKPDALKPWKHPEKRRKYILGLKAQLEANYRVQKKLAARRTPLLTSFLRVAPKGSKGRGKSKPRGTTKRKPLLKTPVRVAKT